MRGDVLRTPDLAGVRVDATDDGVCIGVRVTPAAPQSRIIGLHGDRLKVAVAAPPEDNRANKELEHALAGWLTLRRDTVRVVKGHASRDKVVAFTGLDEYQLRESLGAALEKR